VLAAGVKVPGERVCHRAEEQGRIAAVLREVECLALSAVRPRTPVEAGLILALASQRPGCRPRWR